jgi:hypothetical protein
MLTQMRETQASSQLQQEVNNYGVTVQKSASAPLMAMGLYSPKRTYDAKFLTNYAYINLNDQSNGILLEFLETFIRYPKLHRVLLNILPRLNFRLR